MYHRHLLVDSGRWISELEHISQVAVPARIADKAPFVLAATAGRLAAE